MSDTHAAAVAALRESNPWRAKAQPDDEDEEDAAQQLRDILADPAKRAALLAVLLGEERLAEALNELERVEREDDWPKALPEMHHAGCLHVHVVRARLTEPDRSETP